LEITKFFGIQAKVTQQIFNKIKQRRPNALINVPTISSWNASEITEFEVQVASIAKKLGYEYRVTHLPIPKPILTSPEFLSVQKPSLKNYISRILHQLKRRIPKM
jgi:hypothetical protein